MKLSIAESTLLKRLTRVPDPARVVPRVELTGTYDFKWPLGSEIRIAIQQLPADGPFRSEEEREEALAAATAKLRRSLEAWGIRERVIRRPPAPQLAYRILEETWLPPAKREARSGGGSSAGKPEPYDILVSFAPLPVDFPPTPYQPKVETVWLPQSELGTYARRLDLGLPSMFLGPSTARENWSAWLDSPHATFVFLHEVGHALGLAHEHQNPMRQLPWTSAPKVKQTVIRNHLQALPEGDRNQFLEIEMSPWPKGKHPGEATEDFSEWRDPADPESDSVMVTPYYRCLLKSGVCPPVSGEQHGEELYNGLGVSAQDLAQLARMYQYPAGGTDATSHEPMSAGLAQRGGERLVRPPR